MQLTDDAERAALTVGTHLQGWQILHISVERTRTLRHTDGGWVDASACAPCWHQRGGYVGPETLPKPKVYVPASSKLRDQQRPTTTGYPMKPLRLFLVDDENAAIRRLTHALEGIDDIAIVGIAHDGEEAFEKLGTADADIIFLDIEMPRLNGIELAGRLQQCSAAQIIFVTGLSEWAVEAFALDATDYVLKPVQQDRIVEAISRARRRIDETQRVGKQRLPNALRSIDEERHALWIPKGNSKVRVFVDDIVRVEASKDYALIYTSNNTFILRATMKQLSERFDGTGLIRVHRSAFLNLKLVLKAEYAGRRLAKLHTEDGAVVEVSTRYSRHVEVLIGAC